MYGKIFDTIYDGTLVEDWRALITFQQMIVLCDADGTIDMTPSAISRRTGIPIEHIKAGIEILENPDPYSRTPGDHGCRIVRLDEHRPWGWYIVNHKVYRDLASAEDRREQNRINKQNQRSRDAVSTSQQPSAMSAHTDTDTNTLKARSNSSTAGFDEYWKVNPRKRKKKGALAIWKRKNLSAKTDLIVADVTARLTKDEQWLGGYIPDPTTYLNGELWNDEMKKPELPVEHTYRQPEEVTAEQRDADILAFERDPLTRKAK